MARVAIDARLLAYQRAGTATYIRGLLGGLRRNGRDDILVVASRHDRERQGLGRPRVEAWTPAHHRWERWTLGLELAAAPIDVLHSPDFIPPRRFGRRWARVITVHDLAFARWPDLTTPESRRYYGQIDRAVADADRVIAVSETTRRDLLELIDRSAAPRIAVIPEGVEDVYRPFDRTRAAERVRARHGLEGPFFLFVGTIEPRKNLARLFEGFRRFAERAGARAPSLVLAGSRGWLDAEIDAAAAPLGGLVRFLGRVEQLDLVRLYNAAVAVVLVSVYEGFGLPALEAMACATPVLVSNCSSLPEVVGDAGFYVQPDDVDSIADGLQQIWEDPEARRARGERGRARANDFTWDAVARRTSEEYARAVACAS